MLSRHAKVIVTEASALRQAQSELVMAWAQDATTGRAIYVLELDGSRRGKKSGCKCIACGSPLTAVNAAATHEIEVRPHFRHPEGTRKDSCLVLAARAALLNQLQEGGWIQLPSRKISSRFIGLSGATYEAWVEGPRERRRIHTLKYLDAAKAIITLDDGREVVVDLVGTQGETTPDTPANDPPVPTIYIQTDDLAVAAMGPEEIRERLSLVPDHLCWRHHWDDAELAQQALDQASAQALACLDAVPDGLELPDDMSADLRRESVLHFVAKQILAEEKRVAVPEVFAARHATDARGKAVRKDHSRGPHLLELSDVRLEQRVGALIPDLSCRAQRPDGSWSRTLLIEVTVTNTIDEERMRRIQELGFDALEIDLGRAGGRVTRDVLKQIVVDAIANKRWLANPEFDQACSPIFSAWEEALAEERRSHENLVGRLRAAQAAATAVPLERLVDDYRKAVIEHCGASLHCGPAGRLTPATQADLRAAERKVATCVAALTHRGYPESGDEMLLGEKSLLARLYSIRYGRPIGYNYESLFEVMNAIMQVKGRDATFHSVICMVYREYLCKDPEVDLSILFTDKQREAVDAWVDRIRQDLRANKAQSIYARDPIFDRLLSVLFPKIAEGLKSSSFKRSFEVSWNAKAGQFQRGQFRPMTVRLAAFVNDFKPPVMANPKTSSQGSDLWLKGRDLEEWAIQNPDMAAQWADAQLAKGQENRGQ